MNEHEYLSVFMSFFNIAKNLMKGGVKETQMDDEVLV